MAKSEKLIQIITDSNWKISFDLIPYCIRLSLNKSVYFSAAELVRYLESAKEIAGRAR